MSLLTPPMDAEPITPPDPPAPSVPPPAPAPEALPDGWVEQDEGLIARCRETDWLDVQWSKGAFHEYTGEYIITAEHVLLAHNRSMMEAYIEAEKKADELGIPHWKLVNYYCDGILPDDV